MVRLRHNAGFSLIELLIVAALTSVIMMGVYTAFLSMQTTYDHQSQVAEMQQNARQAMRMITQDLRQAGYGMSDIPDIPIWQYNNGTSSFKSFYPINEINSTNVNLINGATKLANTDAFQLYYNSKAAQSQVPVTIADNNPSSPTAANNKVTDSSQLTIGDFIVVYDYKTDPPQAVMYYVTDIQPNNSVVLHNASNPNNPPGGSLGNLDDWTPGQTYVQNMNLTGSNQVAYYISSNLNLNRCTTKWNGTTFATTCQKIAENIEDMKLEYLFKDGTSRNAPSQPVLNSNGTITNPDQNHDPYHVRAVRIWLLSKTKKQDLKNPDNSKTYTLKYSPVTHGGDGYRRIVLSTEVSLRNMMAKDNNNPDGT